MQLTCCLEGRAAEIGIDFASWHADGGARVRIVVELVTARVVQDEVAYECSERDCPRACDPDIVARAGVASRFPDLWLQKAIVHSTSWRFDRDHLVVTYLAYSEHLDPATLSDRFPLDEVKGPKDRAHAVAAHALRHLAFLVREDPRGYVGKLRPATLEALAKVPSDVAGRRDLKGAA
jgi:hypothetical protein